MIDPPRKGYTPNACANNRHTWHPLCDCGTTRICLRCGFGYGSVPCACQVPRWRDAELVVRTMEREHGG